MLVLGWIGNCSDSRLPWPTRSTVLDRECDGIVLVGEDWDEVLELGAWGDIIVDWDDGSAPLSCRVVGVCALSMESAPPT
jgi:hypothetical protein